MGQFTEELRAEVNADNRLKNEADIEINGKSIPMFAYPLTGADMDAVGRKNKNFMENPTMGAMADLLILKARSSDTGEKAFDLKDKPLLLRMPLTWFQNAMAELLPDADVDISGSDDGIEDERKN